MEEQKPVEVVVIGREDPVLGLDWGNGIPAEKLSLFGLNSDHYKGNFARFFGTIYMSNLKFIGETDEERQIIMENTIDTVLAHGYDIRIVEPDPFTRKVFRAKGFQKVPDINMAPTGYKVYGNNKLEPLQKYQELISQTS